MAFPRRLRPEPAGHSWVARERQTARSPPMRRTPLLVREARAFPAAERRELVQAGPVLEPGSGPARVERQPSTIAEHRSTAQSAEPLLLPETLEAREAA